MDSSKPTKNQLNALIISDVVQFVSNKCGVTDTAGKYYLVFTHSAFILDYPRLDVFIFHDLQFAR